MKPFPPVVQADIDAGRKQVLTVIMPVDLRGHVVDVSVASGEREVTLTYDTGRRIVLTVSEFGTIYALDTAARPGVG